MALTPDISMGKVIERKQRMREERKVKMTELDDECWASLSALEFSVKGHVWIMWFVVHQLSGQ